MRVWEWWIFLKIQVFWNVSVCHSVFPKVLKECSAFIFRVSSSGPLYCEGEDTTILGICWEPLAQQQRGISQITWTFSSATVLASNIEPWIFLQQIWWTWQWDIACTIVATEQMMQLCVLLPHHDYTQNLIWVHMLLIVMLFSMYALEVLKWNSPHCIPCTILISMHQEIQLQR